jgi:hypothetical protein
MALLRALDDEAFGRLDARDALILRLYYGLDGQTWTKRELSDHLRLSTWRIDCRLKAAVERLLNPAAADSFDPANRREQKVEKVRLRGRERGRPAAAQVRTFQPSAFTQLGPVEGELVKGYYGVGAERPLTRRELAQSARSATQSHRAPAGQCDASTTRQWPNH